MENIFTLNEGQASAASQLVSFINNSYDRRNNPRRFFTLTGDPGTGKTYMVKSILHHLRQPLICATVSHAAKNVLKEAIGDEKVNCVTIAKLLGMTPTIDRETGDLDFKPNKQAIPEIIGKQTIILDEVSMIKDDIAKMILDFVEVQGADLICIGDKHQLAPVKQANDSLFLSRPDANLDQTMRFDERIGAVTSIYKEEIQKIHNDIRPNVRCLDKATKRKDNFDKENDTGVRYTNDIKKMLEEVIGRFKADMSNIYNCRVLVYKNNTVKTLNNYIRKRLYTTEAQFHKGEIVINNGGFEAFDHKVRKNVSIIHNGELLRVDEYEPITVENIPCYSLSFLNKDTEGLLIPVVQDTHVARSMYQAKLQELADNARRDRRQWDMYYDFKNKFATFDYAYAINAYKAQGSSIDHVYVAEGEIMSIHKASMKNKFQAMYVACSRAKKSLTIYKK